MKTIWTLISVLAVANLLALLGFAGWLYNGDRVDLQRVREVREKFTETITEQQAREKLEEEARLEAERAAELAAQENTTGEPISSANALQINLELESQQRESLERMRREVEDLRRTLASERAQLDADTLALKAEQEAFDAERARIAQIEGDGQFKKSVETYRSLKPATAASMFTQIMLKPTVDGGDGTLQVISYLNAMDDRERSKIITEFEKTDPALAADLLERLRTYGLVASGPEDPGG